MAAPVFSRVASGAMRILNIAPDLLPVSPEFINMNIANDKLEEKIVPTTLFELSKGLLEIPYCDLWIVNHRNSVRQSLSILVIYSLLFWS